MIDICEVGPRDGLQNEPIHLTVDDRVELIKKMIRSGLRHIEAVSFVNAKVVPQMAYAEEVMARIPRVEGVRYAGLVLSSRGMDRALECDLDDIHVVLAASSTFNLKNARRTMLESLNELAPLVERAKQNDRRVNAVIGTSFGCPFEGVVPLDNILSVSKEFITRGADMITLADTTGIANPLQVRQYVRTFQNTFPDVPLALHFHNTRGLGLANVFAGFIEGVQRFDSSVGGIGGCPFAPLSVGNVSTEDMIHMFEAMGVETGVDLDELILSAKWLEEKMGHRLSGYVMKAGKASDLAMA